MESINRELERAVCDDDVEKVRVLLDAGADVNHRHYNRDTLLHVARSAEVAEELLLRGASVMARNRYHRESPLHNAIAYNKNLKFIRLLLKHGANVNARNRKGYTPLNEAVKQRDGLEKIKELLEYGANINIRTRECWLYDDHSDFTPLDFAVYSWPNLECAKLLIKMTLIKNFDRDYGKIINLAPYEEARTYGELSRFLEACITEIVKMKTDTVDNKLSLYEFITKNANKKGVLYHLYPNNEKVQDMLINTNYPIYHDIICSKMKLSLVRANLLEKLSTGTSEIYTDSTVPGEDLKKKKVFLNAYCTYNLAKYLSDDDLTNLVEAFNKRTDHSAGSSRNFVEFSQQPDAKLDEEATGSSSTCAKRAKLEFPSE